jgi:hypothetical protein
MIMEASARSRIPSSTSELRFPPPREWVRPVSLRDDLRRLQHELTENEAVLGAVREKMATLEEGRRSDPRAHIKELAQLVPQADLRLNRAAEA